MLLDNITGRLAETYPKFNPSTIQHSDEITNDRRADKSLRKKRFWTADFPLYRVEDDDVILYLARRENNLIFENIEKATKQLIKENNYFPEEQQDIETVINAESTLKINPSDLNLKRFDDEWCYFEINTEEYDELNKAQRAFAERVYGQGNKFIENMKMFKDSGINTTRIYVLNPDYVKKQNKPVARACRLNNFDYGSRFGALGRNVGGPNFALRGVRNVAEGDEKIEVDEITKAYNTFLKNPIKKLAESMTPESAERLSKILTTYLAQQKQ